MVLVFLVGLLAARAAERYGSLHGRILDTSEGGVADAGITAVNQDTGFRRSVRSEAGGAYQLSPLEPGPYKLTVRKEGFRTLVRFNSAVGAGDAVALDFVLPVGSIEETVTVEATPPPIERDDASTGSTFNYRDVAAGC